MFLLFVHINFYFSSDFDIVLMNFLVKPLSENAYRYSVTIIVFDIKWVQKGEISKFTLFIFSSNFMQFIGKLSS